MPLFCEGHVKSPPSLSLSLSLYLSLSLSAIAPWGPCQESSISAIALWGPCQGPFISAIVLWGPCQRSRLRLCRWMSAVDLRVSFSCHRLVGLVVRRPPRERKIPGSNPAGGGIFSGSSHTSDLQMGTPVATLPGAWCYRVSAGTSRPGVSILWLGEMESVICSFHLSKAARKIVCADPSLRYTRMLLGR